MRRLLIFTLVCPLALAGCYAEHWKEDEILVTTMPPGAQCTLTRNGDKVATVAPTPGIAVVSRGPDDIAIDCRRAGYAEAKAVSHAHGKAFDMDTITEGRSGYGYDSPINITLVPNASAGQSASAVPRR